jgi:hypothetical protein
MALPAGTMPAMQKETFVAILEQAPSAKRDGDAFVFEPEHRATLYLGRPGHTTSLTELVRIELKPSLVRAEAKDRTVHFVLLDEVVGLSVRPPTGGAGSPGRTGF